MTDRIFDFSHPATKVARCMAVTSSLPGVNPAQRLAAAYRKANKKHPGLWIRLEVTLAYHASAAIVRGGALAVSLRDGSDGAELSAYPHGNHGDNLTNRTDKAVL